LILILYFFFCFFYLIIFSLFVDLFLLVLCRIREQMKFQKKECAWKTANTRKERRIS